MKDLLMLILSALTVNVPAADVSEPSLGPGDTGKASQATPSRGGKNARSKYEQQRFTQGRRALRR